MRLYFPDPTCLCWRCKWHSLSDWKQWTIIMTNLLVAAVCLAVSLLIWKGFQP